MGQQIGKVPNTWEELMREKDRVLHWSSELLAQINDNILDEGEFLEDYEMAHVSDKVGTWISNHKPLIESTMAMFSDEANDVKDSITEGISKIEKEILYKTKKDYHKGYSDMRKLNDKVDRLGNIQYLIHKQIQQLEEAYRENPRKYEEKFRPLQQQVLNNLMAGEKILLQDKKLKTEFKEKVYKIDKKNMKKCNEKIEKFLKEFKKSATK